MKIVHFIFSFQTGGAETMLIDILNEQVRNNSVTLIILNNEVNEILLKQIDQGVRIIKIERNEKSRNLFPIFGLNWYLLKINPEVIHCHQNSAARIIFLKKNIFLTVHAINKPVKYYKKFRKVFAISETVKKDIEDRCDIKPVLVYNGIDFKKIKQKSEFKFDVFKIVQVSRLDHEKKGQHILIDAMNILVNERGYSNISVDFIGEGASFDYLNNLVKKFKLQNHINFLGLHDRYYIYEHLKDYNLLVQPSIYEGFGLTIVEGMAAKIPVLVSDINGPSEVIQKGKYGWIFKSMNGSDCAQQILNIIQVYLNINFKEKIQDSYEYVNISFSVRNTATRYSNEYKKEFNGI